MENLWFSILLVMFGLIVGIITILIINYFRNVNTERKSVNIIEKAKKEAEVLKRDLLLDAKEEMHKLKLEVDKEIKEKKNEIRELESRLLQREDNINRRDQTLQKRELLLEEKDNNLIDKQREIQNMQVKLDEKKKEQIDLLEKISGLSKEDAKKMIMSRIEENISKEIAALIREKEVEAEMEVDKKAKNMLLTTMQKYAADVASEQTVTVVDLPNDEMKGRIIGREGRNIRTIEAITGVDLIIDDTPEAVVLSSFDPLRREIARLTLEGLIKDGRIHPARIEELYDKTCKEIKSKIREKGEEALFELGITKVDPELIDIIGRLHYRTSYGQNALQHSKEVAHLAGIMANEIGENVNFAKRAGILHDIGKAIDHEIEGSHVEIGVDLAKKYREDRIIINSIASHHGDEKANNVVAVLVAIADALSASRPGARNDSLENYIKRLEQLEGIANEIEGVDKTFAMQAGRELRVIVKPDKIDDLTSYKVARDIKERIEKEMQYPGTIKVTVIRETRVSEEAK
ncbi:MAG: ribonuclease Y [Bacilli bacterium]|nr:ribonuclease Y [Bacilli bacterium]